MDQGFEDFIFDWNEAHENFFFSYSESPVIKRPTSIEVRFSPDEYENIYSYRGFAGLNTLIQSESHGTMCIVTDSNLLKRGIIEIKIASCSLDYSEEDIINTLKKLGEEFLSHRISSC